MTNFRLLNRISSRKDSKTFLQCLIVDGFFEAYQIYSMRWAIEVCFSGMKGLLKLGSANAETFFANSKRLSNRDEYNILSFIKRFEAYETIGGLFNQTINGTMELSVTERIADSGRYCGLIFGR